MKSTEEIVIETALEFYQMPSNKPLTPESQLSDYFDSLDVIAITCNLEKRFTINIADPEITQWRTIRDIINTITIKIEQDENNRF